MSTTLHSHLVFIWVAWTRVIYLANCSAMLMQASLGGLFPCYRLVKVRRIYGAPRVENWNLLADNFRKNFVSSVNWLFGYWYVFGRGCVYSQTFSTFECSSYPTTFCISSSPDIRFLIFAFSLFGLRVDWYFKVNANLFSPPMNWISNWFMTSMGLQELKISVLTT